MVEKVGAFSFRLTLFGVRWYLDLNMCLHQSAQLETRRRGFWTDFSDEREHLVKFSELANQRAMTN